MPILGDFEIVTTGGNFTPTKSFQTTFNTGGRYGAGLGYLLIEWFGFQSKVDVPGILTIYLNGEFIGELGAQNGHATHVVRFGQLRLFANKENTFKAVAKNCSGGFSDVICHFHQST